MTTDKDQNIWKWKNTAHITKTGIETIVALASLAGAITTILIATKVIAGPASLVFVASPAGIAVLFIAAVYFAAAAYASYQQMQKNEEIGVNGKDGKDANFAALVGDALKNGTIVEETVKKDGENDVQKLFLTLSIADYKVLVKDDASIHVLLKDEKTVKFQHVAPEDQATQYRVQLTSVGGKDQLASMKEELGMAADSKSLKVAVSNKDLKALRGEVATDLANIALENAILNAQKV